MSRITVTREAEEEAQRDTPGRLVTSPARATHLAETGRCSLVSVPEGEELRQVKGKGAMGREWGRRYERERGKDFTRKMKKRKLGERR